MNQPTSFDSAHPGADQVSALCDGYLDERESDALFARCRLGDEALAQLSDNARQALLLNRLEGLTQAQIALRLGVSESMVAKYIGQALRHCRDWLQQHHE